MVRLILKLDLVLSSGILGKLTGVELRKKPPLELELLVVDLEKFIVKDLVEDQTRRETRTVTDRTVEETFVSRVQSGVQSRNGTRTIVTEEFDNNSLGDRTVSRDLIATMRSRNVEFVSKKMKPLTRLYAFFDGVDVTKYCVPKLLEISMTSGTFQVGETVEGKMIRTGLAEESNETSPRLHLELLKLIIERVHIIVQPKLSVKTLH